MPRIILIFAATVVASSVMSLLTESRFANASPRFDTPDAYGLIDPSAKGRGQPGFLFQQNMSSVRH
jgi:hypothetical protein